MSVAKKVAKAAIPANVLNRVLEVTLLKVEGPREPAGQHKHWQRPRYEVRADVTTE